MTNMKCNNLIILLVTIFLFNIVLVSADSLYLTDTIKTQNAGSGEYGKIYTLGSNEYNFEHLLCNREDNKCAIVINGKTTGPLSVSDTYNLDNNYFFKIDSITFDFCDNRRFCDYDFQAYDIVKFSIYSKSGFCGDNNCNGEESCSSCPDDCGECQMVCGDGICYANENCEKDNCCNGVKVNFEDDYYNCGGCGKQCEGREKCSNSKCIQICGNGYCESNEDCNSCKEDCGKCEDKCGDGICQSNEDCLLCIKDCACKSYEKCESRKCVTYCGNNICESNEDCSSCSIDCGCEEGYECLNKKCVKPECSTDVNCDDKDACTTDACSGIPKKCSNKRTSGCNFKNNCIPIGTKTESQYCSIENLMEDLKSEDEKCNNNYECSSNVCVNNQCISQSLIQKIINWFRRLFGR